MTEHNDPGDRNQRLYHRVVGAAVLVALAVILIPAILDFRTDDAIVITHSNIPDKPERYRIEEVSLIPGGTPTRAVQGAVNADISPGDSGAAAMDRGQPDGKPDIFMDEIVKDGAPPAWVVQVGSFSSEENALALRDQLRGKGYTAFVDQVVLERGALFRVRVGPDIQRTHSERLREELAREMRLEGVVVGYN